MDDSQSRKNRELPITENRDVDTSRLLFLTRYHRLRMSVCVCVSLSLRHIPYRRHNHHRRKILIIDPVKIKSKEFQTFENCRQYQQLTQVGQNKTWKTSNFSSLLLLFFKYPSIGERTTCAGCVGLRVEVHCAGRNVGHFVQISFIKNFVPIYFTAKNVDDCQWLKTVTCVQKTKFTG